MRSLSIPLLEVLSNPETFMFRTRKTYKSKKREMDGDGDMNAATTELGRQLEDANLRVRE